MAHEFDKIRHHKKRAFLAAFAETGNIGTAAKAASISRAIHYVWMEQDDQYAAAFAYAKTMAGETLEEVARDRAIHGTRKPVYSRDGKLIDTVWDTSDTLLIFLLKGAMPDKYKDRAQHEHTGADGAALPIHTVVIERPS